MNTRLGSFGLLLAALMLTACDRSVPTDRQGFVRGEVSYEQGLELPESAVVIVQLEDVSLMDAPSVVLAEDRIELKGAQVPVGFEIMFDRGKVDEKHRYAVAARIEDASGLRFITTELHGVSLAESEVEIDVLVEPVIMKTGKETGPAFSCSGNEPFWNLALAADSLDMKRLGDAIEKTRFKGGYTALFGPDGGAFYEWKGQAGQQQVRLRVLPGHCEDTMAGPEEGGLFDFSASLNVDGEGLRGCCRMLVSDEPELAEIYSCSDDSEVAVVYTQEGNSSYLQLQLEDGRELMLLQQISASGAKFTEGDTVFWTKDNTATLELDGAEAVECTLNRN